MEPVQQPETAGPSLLTLLGIEAGQDAVYRLLIDHPDSDPAVMAALVGNSEEVERILSTLVDRGLASAEQGAEGVRYRAAPPILALGPLLESRRAALHRVEQLVTELADRHHAAQSGSSDALVEILSGAAVIRRWLVAMQRGARSEVRFLIPAMRAAPVISYQDNLDEAEREMMRRGVTIRTVVERSWLENPASARSLMEVAAQGQQICVTDELPAKLFIADDDVALLSLDPDRDDAGEPAAVVVHPSGLLTALIALFEQYFEKGRRLSPPASDQAEAENSTGFAHLEVCDRKIIALLHVGLTDAAIARQLELSRRTVQRRLHQMMESAGVATRFQLGWHAAVSGWLSQDPVGLEKSSLQLKRRTGIGG